MVAAIPDDKEDTAPTEVLAEGTPLVSVLSGLKLLEPTTELDRLTPLGNLSFRVDPCPLSKIEEADLEPRRLGLCYYSLQENLS